MRLLHPIRICRPARFLVVFTACILSLAWVGSHYVSAEDSAGSSAETLVEGGGAPTLLKAGDVVSVNVFNEPSLSGAFPVGTDGSIVFPLLGAISAAGKSASDVADAVRQLLERSYIRDARVVASLHEVAEQPLDSITVIGRVQSPGQVQFKQGANIDLFTAVSSAGGLSERANSARIELKRRDGGDLRTHHLSLEADRVFTLRNGDTVIVHAIPEPVKVEVEPVSVTIVGAVKTPGVVKMNPGIPFDVITAIAMSGGFSDVARASKVLVRRTTEQGAQTIELNVSKMQREGGAPFLLQANDLVSVPETIF